MKTPTPHGGQCRHCGRQPRQQQVQRAWISVRAFWYAVLGIGLLAVVPALGSLSGNPFVTGLLTGVVIMPAFLVCGAARSWRHYQHAKLARGGEQR